ncbi:DUF2784 domain-containing protein [Halochromatium glycolicum]|nr:DUF2784 domain-containing protein [Halochromatium glycolicum]
MDASMLTMLDQMLLLLHAALIVFNLTGWIWRRTRRAHLLVIGLTFGSWIGLGAWYGWGYCPMTDWHWHVKAALGETGLPASYVKYYADAMTGRSWNAVLVDAWVVGLALMALVFSVRLNWRDWRQQRRGIATATRCPDRARKRGGT